jgi:hypothetical protein
MGTHFTDTELQTLRSHLMQMRSDYTGLSEVIQAFLCEQGYSVSPAVAAKAAMQFATCGRSLASIRAALEGVAQAV